MPASIFVSYASADRRHVERLVNFLEAHGLSCWVSFRDVAIGENYQEAITRALRSASTLMVMMTRNANSSAEIQKELSLASRYNLLVVPLRMEDVEPNDALAYELATRQWIDMFRDWDAGCRRLLAQLRQIVPPARSERPIATPARAPAMSAPAPPQTELPAGSVFVAPRPAGSPAASMPSVQPAPAAASPALPLPLPVPSPAAAVGVSANRHPPDRARAATRAAPGPDRHPAGRVTGMLSVGLFLATFGMVLTNLLQREQTPYLELFFWAILLIGCARLLGAVLRALAGVSRA